MVKKKLLGKKRIYGGIAVMALITMIFFMQAHAEEVPPVTTDEFGQPHYTPIGGPTYISDVTPIWLNATDDASGVNATYYRIHYNGMWHPQNVTDGYGGNTNITDMNGTCWYVYRSYNGSSPVDFGPLYLEDNCNHTLAYFSVDNDSNMEEAKTTIYYVDPTPPDTWIVVDDPKWPPDAFNATHVTTATNIHIMHKDDMAECNVGTKYVHYRVWNGTAWNPDWTAVSVGTEDAILTFNESCTHYVEFYGEDQLGNTGEVQNRTFYVDESPPTITKEYGQPFYNDTIHDFITSQTPIYLNASDASAECDVGNYTIHYRIWNNESGWSPWMNGSRNENVTFYIGEECMHYIEFYAVDDLNNTSPPGNQTVYVDNTPPAIDKTVGEPSMPLAVADGYYVTTSTNITIDAHDEGCNGGAGVYKIEYRIWYNGTWTNWTEITGGENISFDEECLHYLEIRVTDNVGNVATDNETFLVDDTPPETIKEIGEPQYDNGTWVTTSTSIWLNATDYGCNGGVGVARLRVRVKWDSNNDGIWETNWTDVFSGDVYDNDYYDLDNRTGYISVKITFNEECKHKLRWKAWDYLDNEESKHTQIHYVDDSAPYLIKTHPDHGYYDLGEVLYLHPLEPIDPLLYPFPGDLLISTMWHELWPEFCNMYHYTNWYDDNSDGMLSACDNIEMEDELGHMRWYHVENITITLYLENTTNPDDTMYIELTMPQDPMMWSLVMSDPIGTLWHEVWPDFCTNYTLTSWLDDTTQGPPDGKLGYWDVLNFTEEGTENVTWWHIVDVSVDLMVKEEPYLKACAPIIIDAYDLPRDKWIDQEDPYGGWVWMDWSNFLDDVTQPPLWDAQSFKPNASILDAVQLYLQIYEELEVTVTIINSSNVSLGHSTLHLTPYDSGWVQFHFDPPISLTPNATYYIAASTDTPPVYNGTEWPIGGVLWGMDVVDTNYTRGTGWFNGTTYGADYAFKTEYYTGNEGECASGVDAIFWRYEWNGTSYPLPEEAGAISGWELYTLYGYDDPDIIEFWWYVTYGNTTEVHLTGDCLHKLYYWAKDNLGHKTPVHMQKYHVDATPPIIIKEHPEEGYYQEGWEYVAIFKDVDPWGLTSNEDVLNSYGIPYVVYNSSDMGIVNLSMFTKVIIASDQPQAFYDAIAAHQMWFENYSSMGGILEIHAADNGWGIGNWTVMPGGFTHNMSFQEMVSIAMPGHPLLMTPNVITDDELDNWSYSLHGYYLGSLPAGSQVVLTNESGEPVFVITPWGDGYILITTQTLEWGYYGGSEGNHPSSPFLENVILYLSSRTGKQYIRCNETISLTAVDPEPCASGVENLFWRYEWNGTYYPYEGECGAINGSELEVLYGYTDPNITGYWWYVAYDYAEIQFTEECQHELYYFAKDNVCNPSEIHHQTYYVDNTPPETGIDFGSPTYMKPKDVNFMYENFSSFPPSGWYIRSGNWSQGWATHTADGSHSALVNKTGAIDTPSITGEMNDSYTLTFYAMERNDGFSHGQIYIYWDDDHGMPAQSPVLLVHTMTSFGSWEEISVTFPAPATDFYLVIWYTGSNRFLIDDVNVTRHTYDTFITGDTPIYLNATDYGECASGIYKIYYRIWYDGSWHEFEGEEGENVCITLNDLDLGNDCVHHIQYYTVDNVGNTEMVHNMTVYVDNTPPVVTKEVGEPKVPIPGTPNYYITSETPIWINATDSGIEPCIVGSYHIFWEIYDATGMLVASNHTENENATIYIGEQCEHTLVYWVEDDLGNTYYGEIETFYVDNTPPVTHKTHDDTVIYNATEDVWYIKPCTAIILTPDDHEDEGLCAVDNSTTYWGFYFCGTDWHPKNETDGYGDYGPGDIVDTIALFGEPMYGHQYWFRYDPERPVHWQEECCHVLWYFSVDELGNIEGKEECDNDGNTTYFMKPGFRYGPDRQNGTDDDDTYRINQLLGPNGIDDDPPGPGGGDDAFGPDGGPGKAGVDDDWDHVDTDSDGYCDGQEVRDGTDPNNASDFPSGAPENFDNWIDEWDETAWPGSDDGPWGASWCAPSATASCLWWFADWYHMPQLKDNAANISHLADILGNYMHTDRRNGTTSAEQLKGLREYINDVGLGGRIVVSNKSNPTYDDLVENLTSCQDVLFCTPGHVMVATSIGLVPNATTGWVKIDLMDPWEGDYIDTWFNASNNSIWYGGRWQAFDEIMTICPRTYQTYRVDGTPPDVTKTVGGPNITLEPDLEYIIAPETPIWINATDLGLGECVVGSVILHYRVWYNGEWTDWMNVSVESGSPNHTIYLLGNCTHYLEFWVEDDLGNRWPLEGYDNETFHVDNAPPHINKTVGEPGMQYNDIWYVHSDTEIGIDAWDMGCGENSSGLQLLRYRIWNMSEGWGEWNILYNETIDIIPYTFTFGEECKHYLEIEATDVFGHTTLDNETFYVDDHAPTSWYVVDEPHWGGNATTTTNVSTITEICLTAKDIGCIGQWRIHYNLSSDDLGWRVGGWNSDTCFYLPPGIHTVWWYAEDGFNTETPIHNVTFTVIGYPYADFTWIPDNRSLYPLDVITFIANALPDEGVIHYSWDFGDGNGTAGSGMDYRIVTHSYEDVGNKTVTLTITAFGGLLTGSWSHGIIICTPHTSPGTPPDADFYWTPEYPITYENITFHDNSTTHEGKHIEYYVWEFGDGDVSYDANPVHYYENNGTYTVSLIVYDNMSAFDKISYNITVGNRPPEALFSFSPPTPDQNETVTFNASASYDMDGTIVNYTWDFGDGNIGYGMVVTHSYPDKGIYTVILLVTDDDGAMNFTTHDVYVNITFPEAIFTYTPPTPTPDDVVTFNASDSHDPDGTIVNWTWDFGDGHMGYGEVVTHQYLTGGVYPVTLTVRDNNGAENSTSQNVTVYGKIDFTFTLYPGWNYITIPVQNSFTASSLVAAIGGWDVVWQVSRYNSTPNMGSYDDYWEGGAGEVWDFPIEDGVGYWIYINNSRGIVNFTVNGYPIFNVSVDLDTSPLIKFTSIGWFKLANINASDLLHILTNTTEEFENSSTSIWINNGSYYGWKTYQPDTPFEDYVIETGMGVMVWLPTGNKWEETQFY